MVQVQFIPGIKINRNRIRKTITLSQKIYIDKILRVFGMENCKPVNILMDPCSRSTVADEINQDLNFNYQKAVGILDYLKSFSQPDLACETSVLSQFLDKPFVCHVSVFKRILRYLQGMKNYELTIGGAVDITEITGYSDSDWGSNYDVLKIKIKASLINNLPLLYYQNATMPNNR
ncbi:hypothetical protein O181_004032 [Austropuccinia psidii MF-1]|uniref:Reverse transcriptase Ty1/copia-type domain-containing protein n=1 Tax=Austropuccinia psidii MF-1 TaxID=1389203 RepID=A0A9Q3BFG8_9BASI|nr:hypothetical protein [Austropuccinia psidii MF-1]